MADFSLKSGADTLDFNIQGKVMKGGADFGAWKVADDNQISVIDAVGGTTAIPVDWQFNAGNQLELHQGGNLIFNFHGNPRVRPDLQAVNGVLLVAPDQNAEFSVSIHGDWSMDDQFNLLLTVGTVKSTINGILRDTDSSEFIYIFITQAPASRHYELDFTGKWQQNGSGTDVDFIYDKENGATGTIELPAGLTMDPVKNILVYTYNKGTHTGSLELAGTIRVNSNFSVTYVLDQQDDAGIKSTTFSIAATIKQEAVGEGNLQLLVQRKGQEQTLEIGGDFHGAIAGLDLTVGFTYKRTISGTTITDTVAFTGSITNPGNGNTFSWGFTLNGKDFTIDLSAHIMLSAGTCFNAVLNVTVNGQQLGITAIFGVSTNCGQARPAALSRSSLSPSGRAAMDRLRGVM